jgi:hypothetical protein
LKNTFATDMNVSFMLGITLKLITPFLPNPLRHLSLKEAFQIKRWFKEEGNSIAMT